MNLDINKVELVDLGFVVDPYISKNTARKMFGVSSHRSFKNKVQLFFELIEDGYYDPIVVSSDGEIFNYFALRHYQLNKEKLKQKNTRKYAVKFDKVFIEKYRSLT